MYKNMYNYSIQNLKELFACMKLLMISVLNSHSLCTDKYNIFLCSRHLSRVINSEILIIFFYCVNDLVLTVFIGFGPEIWSMLFSALLPFALYWFNNEGSWY